MADGMPGFERWSAAALALVTLFACSRSADPVEPPRSPAASANGTSDYFRDLQYADQDLADFVLSHEDKETAAVIQLLKAGKPKEAAAALTPAALASRDPSTLLMVALIKQRNGDVPGAKTVLRGLVRASELEGRWRLWAAHALRQMGEQTDGTLGDELLGVVAATRLEKGVDSLAVYMDGNVRYVNQGGGMAFYVQGARGLEDQIKAANAAAKAVYLQAPMVEDGRPPFADDEFRFTFLTLRGPRRATESLGALGHGTPYDALYLRLFDVLGGLTKLRDSSPGRVQKP
jgi:hypothetical protein